jgi:peptidyl-tRNA hydrolase, PTH2 family
MNNPDEMKQVIVIRRDLKMRQGKACSMSAHASLKTILDFAFKTTIGPDSFGHPEYQAYCFTKDSYIEKWLNGIFTKVTVRVESEEELLSLYAQVVLYNMQLLKDMPRLPVALIKDAGLTEFHGVPTLTCMAVGPAPIELVNKFTGHLKLL